MVERGDGEVKGICMYCNGMTMEGGDQFSKTWLSFECDD